MLVTYGKDSTCEKIFCPRCATSKVSAKYTRHQDDSYILVKYKCAEVITDTMTKTKIYKKSCHSMTIASLYNDDATRYLL